MAACAGCGQTFMISGLASHLKQTRNSQCKAIFETQYGYIPDDSNLALSSDDFCDDFSDPKPMNLDLNLTEYDNDFNVPPASGIDESDDNSDADLDDIFNGFDIGWELAPSPEHDNSYNSEDDDRDLTDFDERPPLECSTVHNALQNPGHIEQFNDTHPHAQSGICIGAEDDMNMKYQVSLSDKRIWVLFTSRIDWEIAHWAKLRGPSSTALSELLAIEGVSGCSYHSLCN